MCEILTCSCAAAIKQERELDCEITVNQAWKLLVKISWEGGGDNRTNRSPVCFFFAVWAYSRERIDAIGLASISMRALWRGVGARDVDTGGTFIDVLYLSLFDERIAGNARRDRRNPRRFYRGYGGACAWITMREACLVSRDVPDTNGPKKNLIDVSTKQDCCDKNGVAKDAHEAFLRCY